MRSIILNTNKFAAEVVEKSKYPEGISPEKRNTQSEQMENCLVVLFCVENGDGEKQVNGIYQEILKTADEIKTKNLMIAPFVHLSNNIAKPDVAEQLYNHLKNKLTGSDFIVKSSHFGYHKTLLLDVKGHPGSIRYREFY